MHRHFVSSEELTKDSVLLDRAGARHFVNVLRLKDGDTVELFDGKGKSALFRLSSVRCANGTVLSRSGEVKITHPPACRIALGVAISKGRRMDWTIEKAVELGVSEIVPILSKNSVVRLDEEAAEDKRERWERVAVDAVRQCGSAYLPKVLPPMPFAPALEYIRKSQYIYVGALTEDAITLRDALARDRLSPVPSSVAWVIGPEGDFTKDEYDALRKSDARMVSLGSLILRAETAALYGLCVLSSEWN